MLTAPTAPEAVKLGAWLELVGDGRATGGSCPLVLGGWMGLGKGGVCSWCGMGNRLCVRWSRVPPDSLGSGQGVTPPWQSEAAVRRATLRPPECRWEWGLLLGERKVWVWCQAAEALVRSET